LEFPVNVKNVDIWRLAEEVSVVDSALLIAGYDPSSVVFSPGTHLHAPTEGYLFFESDGFDPQAGYLAAFASLRAAIMSDRLAATVSFDARAREADWDWLAPDEKSSVVPFDVLVRAQKAGDVLLALGDDASALPGQLEIIAEPNWKKTMIAVDNLRAWLTKKAVAPPFFFPGGRPEGFRDPLHARYSGKLHCAVAAWEAVEAPAPNRSVKDTLFDFVKTHGVQYGMGTVDGIIPNQAAEDISKVSNWQTKGGATKTAAATDVASQPVNNFGRKVHERG
jgi:hypothetical protein